MAAQFAEVAKQRGDHVLQRARARQHGIAVAQQQIVKVQQRQHHSATDILEAVREKVRGKTHALGSGQTKMSFFRRFAGVSGHGDSDKDPSTWHLTFPAFRSALVRLGLTQFNDADLRKAFDHFEPDASGVVRFKGFAHVMFEEEVLGSSNGNSTEENEILRHGDHDHVLATVERVQHCFRQYFGVDYTRGFQKFMGLIGHKGRSMATVTPSILRGVIEKILPNHHNHIADGTLARVSQEIAPAHRLTEESFIEFVYDISHKGRNYARERFNKQISQREQLAQNSGMAHSAADLFRQLKEKALQTGSTLRIFSTFTTEGQGRATINLESFRSVLRNKHRLRASDAVIRELFDILDLNGNGLIELDEFVTTVIDETKFSNLVRRHRRNVGSSTPEGRSANSQEIPALPLYRKGKADPTRPKTSSAYMKRSTNIAFRHAQFRNKGTGRR